MKIVLSEIAGPTKCDIAQVRKAYKDLSLRARPAPVAGVPEDESEDPEVDNTPLVVPHP